MIVCTACNAENLNGETICHQCDAKLPTPATADCVSCKEPVKFGAKFCKHCGAAQPNGKSAAEDDSEQAAMPASQAREAVIAQAKVATRQHAQASPLAAKSQGNRTHRTAPTMYELAATQQLEKAAAAAAVPKHNYVAIGLGIGAFVVVALVSSLALMGGRPSNPPSLAAASPPLPVTRLDASVATAPIAVAPPAQKTAIATPVAPEPSATISEPPAPAQPAPVVIKAAPVVPAQARAAAPATPAAQPADVVSKKTKAEPANNASAEKRKQAEEALQRLLNQ
ncbi:MAG TPA: zinc ribbon domain-containing protein [Rhodocyclaceae bacterium]|nr:zinc ribbon domain-containing protein [Rhodocyclaceae bacterium]